jgi:2-oxoglutarate dehydrogenase E1 component
VYYDLLAEHEKRGIKDIAILRVEQFYPFDAEEAQRLIRKYSSAKEICWAQEEPKNMGGWSFLMPLLTELLLHGQVLRYIGRDASASTATGSLKIHTEVQKKIVVDALQ